MRQVITQVNQYRHWIQNTLKGITVSPRSAPPLRCITRARGAHPPGSIRHRQLPLACGRRAPRFALHTRVAMWKLDDSPTFPPPCPPTPLASAHRPTAKGASSRKRRLLAQVAAGVEMAVGPVWAGTATRSSARRGGHVMRGGLRVDGRGCVGPWGLCCIARCCRDGR